MKLTDLEKKDDTMVLAAICNTFLQHFEADSMDLYVGGEEIVADMAFIKNFKEMKDLHKSTGVICREAVPHLDNSALNC